MLFFPYFRRNINTKVVANNAALHEKLKSVLDGFNAPIRYAVAYGSGAYPQKGYDDQTIGKDTMVFNYYFIQPYHLTKG